VLQQPLWKDYFVLCSSWNIDLTSQIAPINPGKREMREVGRGKKEKGEERRGDRNKLFPTRRAAGKPTFYAVSGKLT
jgi:hypothetical protein